MFGQQHCADAVKLLMSIDTVRYIDLTYCMTNETSGINCVLFQHRVVWVSTAWNHEDGRHTLCFSGFVTDTFEESGLLAMNISVVQ